MSDGPFDQPREHREAVELIAARAARARAGSGALVVLRGATGTGRTTVLEAAGRAAEAHGMRVLRARCSPGDAAVPFAAVRQLLGARDDFGQVAGEREQAEVLRRALHGHAAEGPLLVAVDDVHLADGPSHRWLVETARHLDRLSLPILLAVTERSQYDVDAPRPGFTHTLPPALVHTRTLAPLTGDSAAALVRARFPAASPSWTEDCVRAGGGSPLLLRALLDDLAAPDGHLAVPESTAALYPGAYPAAVSWWLDSAGPGTAEVARSLAVLDEGWDRGEPLQGSPAAALGPAPHPYGTLTTEDRGRRRPPDHAFDAGRCGEAPGPYDETPGPYGGLPDPYGDVSGPYGEAPGPYGEARGRYGDAPGPYGDVLAPYGDALPGPYGEVPPLPDQAPASGLPDSAPETAPPHGTSESALPSCAPETAPPPHAHRRPEPPTRTTSDRTTPDPTTPDPTTPTRTAPTPTPAGRDRHGRGPAARRTAGGDGAAPAALLAGLAGADPARVAGWLTAMTGLGLLRKDAEGRPRYAHPLLRDAVLTGVPAARRRAAHRAVAEAMLHHGAPTDAVAGQLLSAGPVGAAWAAEVLQAAADRALRAERPQDAMAFLRRALDEPLPGGRRQRLLTELGSLECACRDSAAGIPRLTEALRQPGTPQDRVRAAVALGTALAGDGRARAAVEVLGVVDGQLADRPELVGALRIASALLSDWDSALRRDVYGLLRAAAARSPEPSGPAARALLVRHAATAGLVSARDAMRQVRELLAEPADALTEPFLLGTAAAVAQWADELDEADRLVDRGLAGQRPGLLHPMHQALLNTRADIEAARGRYGLLPAEPPVVFAAGPGNTHAHILLALVEQGRTAEARRLADAFDLGAAPDSFELNRFLYARGAQRAAEGDHAGALHDFLECGRRQAAREVVSPVVTPWRTAAAECRLALGGPREALALAEEELRLARVWDTPRTVGRALRVLAAATGGRHGLELAGESVRLLRDAPSGAEPELVAALLGQGRQLSAAGQRTRAREFLREAAERAERLGAVRLRVSAEEALRAVGARSPGTARTGSAALTGSERRIAELAADGRTNTEIADSLHLARRTVETHLTSAYKKLGIRRRGELRDALGPDRTGGRDHHGHAGHPGHPGPSAADRCRGLSAQP
ncbi:AAA family ATPase [Streptomyces sp. GMY01]|uniref:helix-turn-helix transcriptional regulator n=1 Tax=Streptomyces sp. GMY02 TaxID=1333528 RepID=UPI00146D8F74|nr:LuxR C-terminal-related transcriptional regulator [Streptomyces sp. GMY02]NMO32643.1 AAA family ATPase [Streptomyces sp. GMY02]